VKAESKHSGAVGQLTAAPVGRLGTLAPLVEHPLLPRLDKTQTGACSGCSVSCESAGCSLPRSWDSAAWSVPAPWTSRDLTPEVTARTRRANDQLRCHEHTAAPHLRKAAPHLNTTNNGEDATRDSGGVARRTKAKSHDSGTGHRGIFERTMRASNRGR
jgi:hypothetical protein